MNSFDLAHIIHAAVALLRRGHCKGTYAKNAHGDSVGSCSSDASSWCIVGAIDNIAKHDDIIVANVLTDIIRYHGLTQTKGNPVVAFSDKHSVSDCIDLLLSVIGEAAPKAERSSSPNLTEYTEP